MRRSEFAMASRKPWLLNNQYEPGLPDAGVGLLQHVDGLERYAERVRMQQLPSGYDLARPETT